MVTLHYTHHSNHMCRWHVCWWLCQKRQSVPLCIFFIFWLPINLSETLQIHHDNRFYGNLSLNIFLQVSIKIIHLIKALLLSSLNIFHFDICTGIQIKHATYKRLLEQNKSKSIYSMAIFFNLKAENNFFL